MADRDEPHNPHGAATPQDPVETIWRGARLVLQATALYAQYRQDEACALVANACILLGESIIDGRASEPR